MESLVFHVEADRVGTNLLDSIKAYFGTRRVQVIVKLDESLPETTGAGRNAVYSVPGEEWLRLIESFDADELSDVISEIKRYRVEQ